MQKVLQLDPRDNVLIALTDLREGEHVQFKGRIYPLLSSIPAKHKFVITDLPVGGDVIMYGVLVGKTYQPVRKGEVLTLRNLRHEAAQYHQKSSKYAWRAPNVARWRDRKFLGYRRAEGQVGTRNYWIVVTLVFCENRNILNLKQALAQRMSDIIDLDTGSIITGESTIEQMGEQLLDRVVHVASGDLRTKAEENNQEDFIPWKRGISL